MLIYRSNQNHRYHLTTVLDTPNDAKQKSGIAGYSRCLGWLLEKLQIAVCFLDGNHKFYLNRKSAIKYIKRHQEIPLDEHMKVENIRQALLDLTLLANSERERPSEPQVEKDTDFSKQGESKRGRSANQIKQKSLLIREALRCVYTYM